MTRTDAVHIHCVINMLVAYIWCVISVETSFWKTIVVTHQHVPSILSPGAEHGSYASSMAVFYAAVFPSLIVLLVTCSHGLVIWPHLAI